MDCRFFREVLDRAEMSPSCPVSKLAVFILLTFLPGSKQPGPPGPITTNSLGSDIIGGNTVELFEVLDDGGELKETQTESKTRCEGYGWTLPILDSTELFTFFCDTLRANSRDKKVRVDASDAATEGQYIWGNNNNVDIAFFNGGGTTNGGKDCAIIEDKNGVCKLKEESCTNDKGVMCLQGWDLEDLDLHNKALKIRINYNLNKVTRLTAFLAEVTLGLPIPPPTTKMDAQGFVRAVFPSGFMWASASAAYQIEGAWNIEGKGESIWDRYSHTAGKITNGDTGDVACDSYHLYQEDIKLLKNLGCSNYRFSLSWSRILPTGTTDVINPAGIAYYNCVIDALLEANIEPIVTLYHWDLPQALQDQGGWVNERIVDWFTEYADICFKNFGDRVKWWVTLNEPEVFLWLGYGNGALAPGIKDPFGSFFPSVRNCIRAHTQSYRLYERKYKEAQQGRIGISIGIDGFFPLQSKQTPDIDVVELAYQVCLGMFINPFYGNGDFPEEVLARAITISKVNGLSKAPVSSFTENEKIENKGAVDFLGINNYTSREVSLSNIEKVADRPVEEFRQLFGLNSHTRSDWKKAPVEWLYIVPSGLRVILNWVKKAYDNPPVFITENGTTDGTVSQIDDTHREDYITQYINEVLKAAVLDECQVIGYTVWCLFDNFEWTDGYGQRFGLHHVDFDDPKRPRTPKKSVETYKKIIKNNGFPAE